MNNIELSLKRYPNEKSAVRFFDSKNQDDIDRLRLILKDKEVQERMDSVARMSKSDMRDWIDERGIYGRYYLFAVMGTEEVFRNDCPEEIGKVQGFVYLYAGAEERRIVERIEKTGLINESEIDEEKIFEISFAKLPKAPGGQISSGVRQACMELKRLDKLKGGTGAFVYCFIDESNEGSIRVVEACGFVRRGKHFYEEDSQEMSALYVLDYDKLSGIMENRKNIY